MNCGASGVIYHQRKTERYPSPNIARLSTTRSPALEISDLEAARIVRSRHPDAGDLLLGFRVSPSGAVERVRLKSAVGVAVPVPPSTKQQTCAHARNFGHDQWDVQMLCSSEA